MKNKLIAGVLTMVMAGANCTIPAFADESVAYTPTVVFEETFPGADGTDLVNSYANKADDNYFLAGFKFINEAEYSLDKTDRFGIVNEASLGRNTIKRLSGQPMSTLQSIYKPLGNVINMNPTEKTVYYVKWSEYIQDQSPDGTDRYGGFKGMDATTTSNTAYDACMIDFANNRVGAGIGNNGGKKMSAFVSYGIGSAPKWDSTALKENTWYDMILRIEANPVGTKDSMSLKVYETGKAPAGGFGAVAEYDTDETYDKLSYYFKAQYCKRTTNGKLSSDMAISANKAECFSSSGTEVIISAENAVSAFEETPTAANKAAAENLINQISTDSIAYGLLSSRISTVEVIPEAELQSVRISGNTDMIGAVVHAETLFGEGIKPDMSYQWYRNNAEISGANSSDYKITPEDIGGIIKVSVTAGSTAKTSEDKTVSDSATVLADEIAIESDIGASNFDNGFFTGWRIMGEDLKLSSSKEIGDKVSVNNNMISFPVSIPSTDKYMRGLSSPIYTNSDKVYYITWVQDALSLDNYKNDYTYQKVEFGTADGENSDLIFGTFCQKGASVQRFMGLYKRGEETQLSNVYIYPGEKYRVVVRIDASSEDGKDCIYYKVFKENDLVKEQPEWNFSDENFTIESECLDKILIQSSKADNNDFGGLKIERYSADDINNIDLAIKENAENAQLLIDALPNGIAKNDLLSKLNENKKDMGVHFTADHTNLPKEGTDTINITICNYDEVYYRNAKFIVAEYAVDGSLLNVEIKNMAPMQEQILSDTINISAEASSAKLMLFEDMNNIMPLDRCVVLQRQ